MAVWQNTCLPRNQPVLNPQSDLEIFVIYFICSFLDFSAMNKTIFRSQSMMPMLTLILTPEFLKNELYNAVALKV